LMDDTSRVSREAQARFREGLGVQFPGATRPSTNVHILPCDKLETLSRGAKGPELDGRFQTQDRLDPRNNQLGLAAELLL
jgi:hypothetical protein